MTISAVSFLAPSQTPSLLPMAAQADAPSGRFATFFSQQLSDVNAQLLAADHGAAQLAAGDSSNLHGVMIQLEQAKMSLQLLMQVRNHVLEAYQDVSRMQL